MQLSNLVIIPIPYQISTLTPFQDTHLGSPCKSLSKSTSQKDDIAWKKSISAFKKFKGKKDKQSKSIKNCQSSTPFLEQSHQFLTSNKNFSLVDTDINFSLLLNQNNQNYKLQQSFDYFDPNSAPFFQFGVSYQYSAKQVRVDTIENQHSLLLHLKKSQSFSFRKQIPKKDKIRQQNPQKTNLVKIQKNCSSEGQLPQLTDFYEDPFIIIKARERKGQRYESFLREQNLKRQDQNRKTKTIKKNFKISRTSSAYSRSIYSNQNSDQMLKEESSQSDEKLNDYGNDELPIIQFDLLGHIDPTFKQLEKQERGVQDLSIYELKENSNIIEKIRPIQQSTQIIQEYNFFETCYKDNKQGQGNEDLVQNKTEQRL